MMRLFILGLIVMAGLALGGAGAVAFQRSGSMPDASVQYHKRQNCHGAYDLLAETARSGGQLTPAELAWAESYEKNAKETRQPCPTPDPALARRAADRVLVTLDGLGMAANYRDQGDAVASLELAYSALGGKTDKLTAQDGFQLLDEAVTRGDAQAAYFKGLLTIGGTFGKKDDYAGGLPLIEQAAAAGHIDAQSMAGAMHANAMGTRKDLKKAFGYFRQAAERGHVFATYLAAQMANEGEGTRKDFVLAYRLARNLADQGEVAGAVLAASALLQQKNVRDHENEVLYWMDVAIRDGDERIRTEVSKFRPQVVALYQKMKAPPEYKPRVRKPCPMKTVCLVNRFTGVQQCTTNKDYWNDCDF